MSDVGKILERLAASTVMTICFFAAVLGFRHVISTDRISDFEKTIRKERDPAYQTYQKYRYAYELYGYLFFSSKEKMEMSNENEPINEKNTMKNQTDDAIHELTQLSDYDYLMQHYYSVHPSTTAPRELMKAENFLSENLRLEQKTETPQILIYHTHASEEYADYGPDNPSAQITLVGERLAELLREKGWNVIHDTTVYDKKGGELDRNRAYTYALEGISQILKTEPSIEVILDLHRDGVGKKTHLVTTVNGKQTANIMFFQGMCRTPEGEIDYLPNPYLKDNLAFTFQMQYLAAQEYPGFTRKIYMKGLRYNLHLRPRSALIEVGAQTNTSEEALHAMDVLAEVLDRVLQGE